MDCVKREKLVFSVVYLSVDEKIEPFGLELISEVTQQDGRGRLKRRQT